jgi:hypothetical protein
LSQKRQFFRRIFWRKYLKKQNIGPRLARLPLTEEWLANI